jgi:peptidoglycan/xylan/chitin deacetylase (PgdA/CDA1 family)
MRRLTITAVLALIAAVAWTGTGDAARKPRARTRDDVLHGNVLASPRSVRVPILMYHRIDFRRPGLPAITSRLTVAPAAFAAQMTWLARHGRHAITQRQLFAGLMDGRPLPAHPFMITFDDGYRDVLGKAAPVLKRLGMPATAYVITGRISNGDSSFLTWGMLRALERDRVEIGSHTITHRDLTSLSDAEATRELVGSRLALQRHLGHPVRWLSYPAGRTDDRIVGIARRAGYLLAVTTEPGADQQSDDPLRLHRFEVLDTTSIATIAADTG